MYNNNKACKRCVEEIGQGEYSSCVYSNKDCHDFVMKMFHYINTSSCFYCKFEEQSIEENPCDICANYDNFQKR